MDLVKVCKALGHAFRLQIVTLLLEEQFTTCCNVITSSERGCCISDLMERFGMPQSTISFHMSVFVESGLMKLEKRGTWSVYVLNAAAIQSIYDSLNSFMQPSPSPLLPILDADSIRQTS